MFLGAPGARLWYPGINRHGLHTYPSLYRLPTEVLVNDTVSVTGWTISTHSSTSGHVLILGLYRSNNATSPTVTGCTWAGNAMTLLVQGIINGNGRVGAFGAYIRGSTTGTQNLVISTGAGARDLLAYVFDLTQLKASSPIGENQTNPYNSTAKSSHSVAGTLQNAGSAVFGLLGMSNGDSSFFGTPVGGTILDSGRTGTSTTVDIAGACMATYLQPSGAFTMGCTSAASPTPVTSPDWNGTFVELLPV